MKVRVSTDKSTFLVFQFFEIFLIFYCSIFLFVTTFYKLHIIYHTEDKKKKTKHIFYKEGGLDYARKQRMRWIRIWR